MRAAWYTEHGPPEVLTVGEQPDPRPGVGEVRVKVGWSGVNPVDWKSRGRGRASGRLQIPHHDGAGVVESVGEGVPSTLVGQRVWVHGAAHRRAGGTAAELTCVPLAHAVPLPDDVSLRDGACLGVPFLTAARCLDVEEPAASVLVFGAGAVGSAVVQLAGPGVRVHCVVRREEQAVHVRALGGIPVTLDSLPDRIDLVVDADPSEDLPHYAERLARGGSVALIGAPAGLELPLRRWMANNVTVRSVLVFTLSDRVLSRCVDTVSALLRRQPPATPPVEVYGLDEVAAAHARAESPGPRKVLVEVGGG